jgi:dTDP-4-amino-4,6-dideoxygalactose transaminase
VSGSRFIPFNRPYATGREAAAIQEAIAGGHLSGNGPASARCCEWLRNATGSGTVLLTHSCTGALEMAVLLSEVGPGDEVIMPSFTFVSTANAVALRGATPVFVDVREDTLNIDEEKAAAAVGDRTRAILPVHYAGVGADMDAICRIAAEHELVVIEDAAQGILSRYRGHSLGSLGHAAALSFHETKNVSCGEGGALLVNDPTWARRAEILHEKGTNRREFFRGHVDKYSWVDIGSSFLLSDLSAAYLWEQLQDAKAITDRRLLIWHAYHAAFEPLEQEGLLRRPVVPSECEHNAHMYYVLCRDLASRTEVIQRLAERGVNAVFHYVPLTRSRAAGWAVRTGISR